MTSGQTRKTKTLTYQAILIASVVLLLAFGIERLGKASGIPSVVFLIVTGLVGKPALSAFGLELNGLDAVVPVIGTIGLVLIVLEGAFDIQMRRDRIQAASVAFFMAGAGLVLCTGLFALVAYWVLPLTPLQALLVAVPFSVISSAVAISSSAFLPAEGREFVVYETSFSDIAGILVFFTLLDSDGTMGGVLSGLLGGGLLSLILGFVCAIGLMLILARIGGHIRFIPLLAGLFVLYATGKLLHLSPLIMVLLFGLVINNLKLFNRFRLFRGMADETYETTLNEFKSLTMELTFAVRGFFFILLGYWADLSMLASPVAWVSALLILAMIFSSRYALLRLARIELAEPLTWIAPRGLITVLLYLEAKKAIEIPPFVDGAVLLVVFASALLITVGRFRWSMKTKTLRSMPL